MIGFGIGECSFSSISVFNEETGQSFKIDGIQDAVLEMPMSTEAEAPMIVSGHVPMEASFDIKSDWNQEVLDKLLYNPLTYKSPEFEMKVNGLVQVRRHRKKRINKKWAKRYGFKTRLVSMGRCRLVEYGTRDGECIFERVW